MPNGNILHKKEKDTILRRREIWASTTCTILWVSVCSVYSNEITAVCVAHSVHHAQNMNQGVLFAFCLQLSVWVWIVEILLLHFIRRWKWRSNYVIFLNIVMCDVWCLAARGCFCLSILYCACIRLCFIHNVEFA